MEKNVQAPTPQTNNSGIGSVQMPKMDTLMKSFGGNKKKNEKVVLGGIGALVILGGILSGYLLSTTTSASSESGISPTTSNVKKVTGNNESGVADESTFKDSAEGVLKKGGIEGEGQYHLERPGGDKQNVYLTSTVIDLGSFEDKKVQVWGQTFAGKKAGWLMDVGKIKVLE